MLRGWRLGAATPLAAGQAARIGLLFLATTLLAATLPPADAGRFFVGLAAARFASPLVALGGTDSALRLASRGMKPSRIVFHHGRLSYAVAVFVAIVAGIVLPVLTQSSGWMWAFGGMVFCLTAAATIRAWCHAIVLSAGRMMMAGSLDALRGVGPLALTGLGYAFGASASTLATLYALGALAAGTATVAIADRRLVTSSGTVRRGEALDRRHSLKVAIGGTMRAMYESVDQLILPVFVPLAAVRDYGLAASATYAFMAAVGARGEVALPRMYAGTGEDIAGRERSAMFRLGVVLYFLAVTTSGVVAALLRAPSILWISTVLALVLPLRALSYLPLAQLTADKMQATRNRIELGGAAGNALLNVLVIPLIGPLGAASTSAVAEGWMAWAGQRNRRSDSDGEVSHDEN